MKKRFDVRLRRAEPTKRHLNTTIEKIGITKKEITEMFGISVGTMTNWVSGGHPIPFVYQVVLEVPGRKHHRTHRNSGGCIS